MRIGIFFGGNSREREISFAGGRTVYDNLDKSVFEPVPIFVDSFNNLTLLNWEFVYKGSIRDFFPPVKYLNQIESNFQIYQESLAISALQASEMRNEIGIPISISELNQFIDFAFLALHGENGEDGRLQGLLEWIGIPYSGSGIFSSALGINKAHQKQFLKAAGFQTPNFDSIKKSDWDLMSVPEKEAIFITIEKNIGFPLVIKPANQGSSIGVSILIENTFDVFSMAIENAFFRKIIEFGYWSNINELQKEAYLRDLTDIRSGLGFPLKSNGIIFYDPDNLKNYLDLNEDFNSFWVLEATLNIENELLIEAFVDGKEFSCIVIEDKNGKPKSLPPTEIIKKSKIFDYKSKYLPGISRKITPIDVEDEILNQIRHEAEKLYSYFGFEVYARIDGFLSSKGEIFLNDPNTTSGMMPSSFFFHQAAEIGLNPSQFLTYIIWTSLKARIRKGIASEVSNQLLNQINAYLKSGADLAASKQKVAVIMGGYSTERHISVESGRNIYEKLSSSTKYSPTSVFLTGNDETFKLWKIPVNLMLKDNADDIAEKCLHFHEANIMLDIRAEFQEITSMFTSDVFEKPIQISIEDLKSKFDSVFIALHGRPGEDGTLQKQFDFYQIPYNGSGFESSNKTIDKYLTSEILKNAGLKVANHFLVNIDEYKLDNETILSKIITKIGFPMICKPSDDGCSSAVKKVNNKTELKAFIDTMFRNSTFIEDTLKQVLNISDKEEFPIKRTVLVEEFIQKGEAIHFLEVTGGLLTHFNSEGEIEYQMFNPSESLAENDILSLNEKFLAGEGQNITPPRYSNDPVSSKNISEKVKVELEKAAKAMGVAGYCRIDAFVKIFANNVIEVYIIEINSLPGMTPATCIFHQTAIEGMKPYDFIDKILEFGKERTAKIS